MSSEADDTGVVTDPWAVDRIGEALQDKYTDTRVLAAQALGRLGDRTAVERLIAALDDEWEVCAAVVTALGDLGDDRAVEPLIACLAWDLDDDGALVARSLGRLGDMRAVKSLIALLNSRSAGNDARAAAAESLGVLGDKRASTSLFAALISESEDVRLSAATALVQLAPPEAMESRLASYVLALQAGDDHAPANTHAPVVQLGQDTVGPSPWEIVANHLHRSAAVCRGVLGTEVMTIGNGPVDEEAFDGFLDSCGVEAFALSGLGPAVLIVGHDGWDEADLTKALVGREGELRVYSQEMVFASLALCADVLDVLSPEEQAALIEGHRGLEYVAEYARNRTPVAAGFPNSEPLVAQTRPTEPAMAPVSQPRQDSAQTPRLRPASPIVPSPRHAPILASNSRVERLVVDFSEGDWPTTGVLKNMGYVVGHNGEGESTRHRILARVFEVELVARGLGSDAYIAEWGGPKTAVRLHKMANCLASFAVAKKRMKSGDYSEAIADWESDLHWLEQTYYRANMGFRWPETRFKGR